MSRFFTITSTPFRFAWSFAKRRPWIAGGITIVALLVLVGIGSVLSPSAPQYVTEQATQKDVIQTVETVGTIISERDLSLQFPTSGVVAYVYVKEGDAVRAGQRLAALRAGTRAADIAAASAQVQSALADLRAIQEGSRPEDIAILEAQVANKRASLQAARTTLDNAEAALDVAERQLEQLREEARINLSGYVTTSRSSISQQVAVAQTSLGVLEGVINNVVVQDALVKSGSDTGNRIKQQINSIRSSLSSALNSANGFADYQGALSALRMSRDAVTSASIAIQTTYDALSSLATTSYYTDSVREEHKSTVSAERSKVQAAVSALDSAVKTLQDASAGLDTRIAGEVASVTSAKNATERAKADIQTYQTSLQIDEAQLALKRAPARKTDVDSAQGRLRSAQASLARAAASYNETILTAPIDGTITKVNLKPGEYSPVDAAVTMLGSSPYRVEMFVSEIDVPKLLLTQTGSIELDAFPGVDYKIRVSEIDAAPTVVEGVSKYRTKLDFIYPHEEFKIGMKGDVTVVTGEKKNVVAVPGRAIIENDDGDLIVRILDADGTVREQEVTTGLEGDSDTEILSGLQGDETIVVLTR